MGEVDGADMGQPLRSGEEILTQTAAAVLACSPLDFSCPALLQAAAARAEPCKQLAAMLGQASTPASEKAKASWVRFVAAAIFVALGVATVATSLWP